MIEYKTNVLTLFLFKKLYHYKDIIHFVSTRKGGFSKPPYNSLNLGLHTGDDIKDVINNRKLLASAVGTEFNRYTFAKQTHSGNVIIVSGNLAGSGSSSQKTAINNTDAMITNVPGVCLIILVADCVPMLFYDPFKKAIGVAHAGWRGTLKLIAANTVNTMMKKFGSLPEDILVGIGPSIGPCCYKVGPEVLSQVKTIFSPASCFIKHECKEGTGYLDLWNLNCRQLLNVGVPEKNIEIAKLCTAHNQENFFSYRGNKGETGRFGIGIELC